MRADLVQAASKLTLVALIGSGAAACSSDTARFTDNPFSNPFKTASADADPVRTGSIDGAAPSVRRSSVQTQALPAVGTPPAASAPARTASGGSGWSTAGGTAITVGSGDTLSSISSRYGVPGSAILSANHLSGNAVAPGQRIVIPIYSASGEAPATGRVVSSAPVEARKPPVAAAEATPRRRPGQPPVRQAEAPKAPHGRVAQAEPKPAAAPKPAAVAKAPAAEPKPTRTARAAEPVPTKPAPAPAEAPKPVPAKEPDSTGALPAAQADAGPGFRWPARGRVINGFGGGSSNEGINIAVPDGTPVKAAGDGVVAYAGSEVKGYGNLVLIRHENGFVSAYAHNGEMEVKRGQKVARGQTIAKSGQTGNVTSPQLHFEIRKGSTPVDPMRFLASAN